MISRLFAMVTTGGSAKYTPHALSSFFKHTPWLNSDRFILIDNDGDYSPTFNDPRIEILRNTVPLGFAENGNQLIDLALREKRDLFFLNNDIILTPNWLPPLLEGDISIVTPLSNREVQYDAGAFKITMVMELEQYLGKERELEQLVAAHAASTHGYLRVTVLPFFCVRIPYAIMLTLGHFDTTYGKGGGEDYDYCLRAYLAGFGVRYALQSYALHFGGKSSYSGVETKEQQDNRELQFRSFFGYKWGPELMKFLLFEDRTIVPPGSQHHEAIMRGEHAQVIAALKGDKQCDISIWYGKN